MKICWIINDDSTPNAALNQARNFGYTIVCYSFEAATRASANEFWPNVGLLVVQPSTRQLALTPDSQTFDQPGLQVLRTLRDRDHQIYTILITEAGEPDDFGEFNDLPHFVLPAQEAELIKAIRQRTASE